MIPLEQLKVYVDFLRWPVFPCHAQGSKVKAPLTVHGHKDASLDWQQIEEWYKLYPNCAWGVPTSAERAALDVDPRHGGHLHLGKLVAEHGELPVTPKVLTGGAGIHYWLRCPPGTRCQSIAKSDKPEYDGKSNKPDSITLKADGGYVVVPPSKIDIPEHRGRSYAWEVRPWEVPLAEAPKTWLLGVKPTPSASAPANVDSWVVQEACADLLTHPGSLEGIRRKTLCQLVGVHLARGDSPGTIYALAEAWANRCSPAFDEWHKHVAGLLRREAGKVTTTGSTLTSNGLCCVPEHGKEGINSEPFSPSFRNGKEGINSASAWELIPSFPPSAKGEAEERLSFGSNNPSPQADCPSLSADASHGLLGEMLTAISPNTEADSAGVLLGWLACFGSAVGRGAWVTVGPRRHHPALYVGIVGRTSDAKGDSWAASLWPYREVEPAWSATCIANGVGSGEGLVERVADSKHELDKDGNVKVIAGALDKRCLLRLSELSQCFKRGRRENATLSEHLRESWDGEPIHVVNRSKNALSASDYSVSVVGDVTPGILKTMLETGSESFDGFANRFLWCAVKRSGFLPDGGSMNVLKPYLERLQSALAFAKGAGELKRDAEADALWRGVYPSLCVSGDEVPHTDRARPYVLRLSMIYALADKSSVIRVEHLRAALAVWDYCRESARMLFVEASAEPDPLWLRLLNAISKEPGISRKGLHEVFHNRLKAEALDDALAHLEASGMAYKVMVKAKGGGRPAECWFAGPKPPDDGEGDSFVNDNHLGPDPWIVQAEADTDAEHCELTNYLPPDASASAEHCELTNYLSDAQGELVSSQAANKLPGESQPELVSSFAVPKPEAGARSPAPAPAWATVETTEQQGVVIHQSHAHADAPVLPSADALAQADAPCDAYGVHYRHNALADAQTILEEMNMTLDELRAEARAELGPWDAGPFRYWRSEEQQLRWYLDYKKADTQRRAEEYERQYGGGPLSPEDEVVLAEIEAMEKAMAKGEDKPLLMNFADAKRE
jgi:hypothetical protein